MMKGELHVVRQDVERVDACAKVTGEAKYTVDISFPDMVYVCYIRSTYAHAKILQIDTTEALKVDGVIGIVTMRELEGKVLHSDVLDDCVRYLGEAVAGVAACNEKIARQAAKKIKVTYEELPAVMDIQSAKSSEAFPVWQDGNVCREGLPLSKAIRVGNGPSKPEDGPTVAWEKGNVEKGYEEADVVVENYTHTQTQFHVCFEPHACVAKWEPGKNIMNMWISTQCLYEDQRNIANILNLPLEHVHVVSQYIGGGFGGKVCNTCKEYALTALLSRKIRRPVRYVPVRAEESISALRHPADFYYKVGAKKDGTITSVELSADRGGGAHTSLQTSFLLGSTDFVAASYVKSPNIKYEGWSLYTNLPVGSAYRGFGYFESGAALLQTLDIAAEKLQMDPVEFLIKNLPSRGDLVGAEQGAMTSNGLKEVIRKCADEIEWKKKWHKPGEKRLPDGRMHGIAVSFAMGRAYLAAGVTSGNAIIKVDSDGKAHLIVGMLDIGQGQVTGLAQIAAETLGIKYEDVAVTWGDSLAPHTNFLSASASTMVTGNAVRAAAEDAAKQLVDYAAPILQVKPEYLKLENGMVQHKFLKNAGIPIAKLVSMPGIKTVVGRGKWSVNEKEAVPRSLAACAVEVAVDTETGKVDVVNMIQGVDCGKAVSFSRIEGQMDGVLSGGLGYVLMEDWAMDQEINGRIMNMNMLDYKIPTALDTMGILKKNIILEDDDPIGPYGARGMGENTLSASAPAILNAVYNAIGVRIHEMPLTPAIVLGALGKLKGGEQ